jgi:hypothetical protein
MMVDRSKWAGKKNRGTPRFLTRDKGVDLRKQLALLESLGAIEKSTTSEYSQVHLVLKPDNGWRLSIDFKILNDATESMETWPLQNIHIMVDRMTRQRPRLYGKMNMTSGYFQTAIDERSRPFTAFITPTGLYQRCRLPMGLKGAASYFQRMMASKALAGMLYSIVELYLDDILVYASDEGEFIVRSRSVFDRFRQYNITLNPKKYSFGLEEVEFVGHILKPDGVKFSTEKREKVLDFPFPERQKHLKSFLRLVNYFRDHVEGLSTMVSLLNDMVNPYKKHIQITWTPQKERVSNQCKRRWCVLQALTHACSAPRFMYLEYHILDI